MPDPKVPEPSAFAALLRDVARAEHRKYAKYREGQSPLKERIGEYFDLVGLDGKDPRSTAWSAAFVSWCVHQAGATRTEFKFSGRHSEFVHEAIQNEKNGTGVFRAKRIQDYAPRVGDLIQNNRNGGKFTYDDAARRTQYFSHSAIVVEKGEDAKGKYVRTIGGNEDHKVGTRRVPLNPDGTVKQVKENPYICVIQCLK